MSENGFLWVLALKMFFRIYRFLGSTLIEGLFDEVTGSEVADSEVYVCEETVREGFVEWNVC